MMSTFPPRSKYFFGMALMVGIQTANAVNLPNLFTITAAVFVWFLFLKMAFETAWRV